MTLIQTFDDLEPLQRAIALQTLENTLEGKVLLCTLNTNTAYALDKVEANLLFDGSIFYKRDSLPYLKRNRPQLVVLNIELE